MQLKLVFWLLLVLYCPVLAIFDRPTHFIFGIYLRCAYSNPFKYDITIWEEDVFSDDRVNDGYIGTGNDKDFIYLRGKQDGGDGGDQDYELYAEIYHTCTHDNSSRYIAKRKMGDAYTQNGFEYLEYIFNFTDAGGSVPREW